jgi:methylmalonyl-CoA mutase N-terminal domain/subunit
MKRDKNFGERLKDWELKHQSAMDSNPAAGGGSNKNSSGIPVKPLYTPLDVEENSYEESLGLPGEYPYTRGVFTTGYTGQHWTIRQILGYGRAEETKKRLDFLLQQGDRGINIVFDIPTNRGYDSDDPLAEGAVGKEGSAVDTLEDMEILFEGIPIEKVSSTLITGDVVFSMYLAMAQKRGVPLEQLTGTITHDVLTRHVCGYTYVFKKEVIENALRVVTDSILFCSERVPKFNTTYITSHSIRESGATAVQEIAFAFAVAMGYIDALLERGADIDSFAPRVTFFTEAHSDLFEEVAKFRAARRLWARLMKEKYGARDPRSWRFRFATQTAGCTLTLQQPENNIVRTTLQALAAVLSGCNSLHTNSFDEAVAIPTEKAARLAIRTQQIIAHESGVCNTIDPLGGSYYIETLTDEIERRISEYLQRIDDMGGTINALEWMHQEVSSASFKFNQEIEEGKRKIVGVNCFEVDDESEEFPMEVFKVDPEFEKMQVERLREVRRRRDDRKVQESLQKIENVMKTDENIMPHLIEAALNYCTVGEMNNVLEFMGGV